jgi:uracil DNA glycosylase
VVLLYAITVVLFSLDIRNRAICSPHPMARGAAEPFVGSCPFRRANDFLGPERKIDWNLH